MLFTHKISNVIEDHIMKEKFLKRLKDTSQCVVILSGGMDSCIATRLAVEKYGCENIHALSFFYKQKQQIELVKAKKIVDVLHIASHEIIDISFLGDMSQSVSSNIVGGKEMPTIKDILGDPTPQTYVPNRNAILMMISSAYAEINKISTVITGLQSQDQYGYYDTTPNFVNSINSVLGQARKNVVQINAPFLDSSKLEEILLLKELDGHVKLLENTMTCYNPNSQGISCGRCPSCSERIMAFIKAKIKDPIKYQIDIDW